MGFATHLGPWLLGTVKEGAGRNTGAAMVTQTVPLVAGSAVTLTLPAGSLVHSIITYMTTGAAGTPNVIIGGVTVGTLSTAAGFNTTVVTAGAVGTLLNTGATDSVLSYTATAASAGTLAVVYTVRAADGSSVPASA